MIAAICFRINDSCRAKIYLAGTYNDIKWEKEYPCILGKDFSVYEFKKARRASKTISVVSGLDGEYILRFTETKRYIIRLEKELGEVDELPHLQNEGNKFLRCDKDENSVTFQFVNYLGRSKMTFKSGEETRTLPFEVVPDKIGYEDDYIELTEALAEKCAGILLEYSGVTSSLYSHTENNPETLLEQFIFLRQFCFGQNIQGLFEAIKRNPDRVLVQEEEFRPLGGGPISKKIFVNPFTYGKRWQRLETSTDENYYVPQEIAIATKKDSLNTPANRFLQYAFERFDLICEELIESLRLDEADRQTECLKEAKAIHNMLERIRGDHFFDEVRALDIMPQNNQVLQKREGYSQVFTAYSILDMALQLDWRGKEKIYEGESKNVALLYEYWLFFELYGIVKSIEGCEAVSNEESPFIKSDKGRITISLTEGKKSCQSFVIRRLNTRVNLYYNRTFSKNEFKTTRYEGSYSRPFRPDYTLAIYPDQYDSERNNGESEAVKNGEVSYIHFDAKYRITDLTFMIGNVDNIAGDEEAELTADKDGSIVNTYKRGDLLKMHTYNDAIRRTIGSYVLYPGNGDNLKKDHKIFSLYDEILPGVGAFAIKLGIDTQGEAELRKFITAIIDEKRQYGSRLNRMKYYSEMVLSEPAAPKSKSVIATMSKVNNKKRPDEELCVIGYIRADKEEDYYFALQNNSLLKNGSEFLFYFYAIKGGFVYTHHRDITRATLFRFYTNQINVTKTYQLKPVLCVIESNELMSKADLVKRLAQYGYTTTEEKHNADFYYVFKVRVVDDKYPALEMKTSEINSINGNDCFSPHSPKVIFQKRQYDESTFREED